MQKLWRVVHGKGVVTEKQGAMIRQKLRHPDKSLRAIAADLAQYGVTNGGGAAYHPQQIREMVTDGVSRLNAYLYHRPLEETRKRTALLMREKVRYNRSTEADPHLVGRLRWWKIRKVGRKPNNSWYESKKDPKLAKKGWYRGGQ